VIVVAITKIFTVRLRLDHLLSYITDGEKTGNGILVSGVNCAPETAYQSMSSSFALNDKPLRVQGYHIIQSFAPDECTSISAHEIGVKLAERLFGEKFQVVVATHANTDVYHNHIAVCSTSFIDGKRYHSCKESNHRLRDISDALCREYGLSVIENPRRDRYKPAAEVTAERAGKPTWKSTIKADVDEAIARASSPKQFLKNLEVLGYEIKLGKDISLRPQGKEHFVRLERNFGSSYSLDAINQLIRARREYRAPISRPQISMEHPKKLPPFARGSIVALYRHYLYLMGYWQQRSNNSNERMHYLLRDDIRKLDAYIEDTRLLEREGINTKSQLDAFYHRTSRAIEELVDERKLLYSIAKTMESKEASVEAKKRITTINNQLKHCRMKLRHCDCIAERAYVVLEKIDRVDVASKEQKSKGHEVFKFDVKR